MHSLPRIRTSRPFCFFALAASLLRFFIVCFCLLTAPFLTAVLLYILISKNKNLYRLASRLFLFVHISSLVLACMHAETAIFFIICTAGAYFAAIFAPLIPTAVKSVEQDFVDRKH